MEIYKSLKSAVKNSRKLAAIGIVAALPYICDSCAYSNHKASAAEIQIGSTSVEETPSLELKLAK